MARQRWSTLWRTQNFLTASAIRPVLDRSGIGPGDLVLDIGAGRGAITAALGARGARVVAIERDPRLCGSLRRRFAEHPKITITCRDFLRTRLPTGAYRVFANPPFDVISAIVTKLTEAANAPDDTFLVMQREAADRYRGRPLATLYALLLRPWFAPSVVHRFRRDDFLPAPGVDVVMLRLRKRGPPVVRPSERWLYRDFVVASFTAWRPSIADALTRTLGPRAARQLLRTVAVDPQARPTEERFASWLELYRAFAEMPADVRSRVAGAEHRLRAQQARLPKRHRRRAPRDALALAGAAVAQRRRAQRRSNAVRGGGASEWDRVMFSADTRHAATTTCAAR